MKADQAERLAMLRRRLKNVKGRALYWSGNPSFAKNRFIPTRARHSDSEGYEIAMCDVRSLRRAIFELTGEGPKDYDPKAAFREAFAKFILPALAGATAPTDRSARAASPLAGPKTPPHS